MTSTKVLEGPVLRTEKGMFVVKEGWECFGYAKPTPYYPRINHPVVGECLIKYSLHYRLPEYCLLNVDTLKSIKQGDRMTGFFYHQAVHKAPKEVRDYLNGWLNTQNSPHETLDLGYSIELWVDKHPQKVIFHPQGWAKQLQAPVGTTQAYQLEYIVVDEIKISDPVLVHWYSEYYQLTLDGKTAITIKPDHMKGYWTVYKRINGGTTSGGSMGCGAGYHGVSWYAEPDTLPQKQAKLQAFLNRQLVPA